MSTSTSRTDEQFTSGDGSCAAWLYRPAEADGDVPIVVMAHGFSATRDQALPGYAEAFAAAGMAALVFDYRHFGDSPGQPRQLLDIKRQQEDYRSALAFARTLPGIDAGRVALWGSSFSGGHVVAVAAAGADVAAVVAQAPFTDGVATLRVAPPVNMARATLAGLRDQLAAARGRPPVLMAAAGEPGTFAAMTAPEALPGMTQITPPGSRWRNEVTARVMLRLAAYRPAAAAAKLAMPLLVCVCDEDQTTPAAPAVRLAERAPRGELRRYPIGHFEIYDLDEAKADQVAFLRRVLMVV